MYESARARPNFSEEDAGRIVHDLYGFEGRVRELPSERDRNFYIRDESGREYVLKVANEAETRDALDFQNRALERLAGQSRSLRYPRVYTTDSGMEICTIKSPTGTNHFVRMLTYLQGVFFAEAGPHTVDLLRDLGRLVGQTDKALEGFSHKAMVRELKWDVKNGFDFLRRYAKDAEDPERRRLVEYYLAGFEARLAPVLPSLRTSVIHNDANDYNVLVTGVESGRPRVTGLIDFGDMLHSCTAYDLAVSAAYAMLGKADPAAAAAQVAEGYNEVYPLAQNELEVLFDLICMRLCMSVVIAGQQQKYEPGNEYLGISERPAWALLHRLVGMDAETFLSSFRWVKITGDGAAPGRGPQERSEPGPMNAEEILRIRGKHLSGALSVSYKTPLNIVRGFMQYLYDDTGRVYLDAVNNVPHVGHCHPRVVEAVQRQAAALNTNTRYLHEKLALYVRRLCAKLPEPLEVCFLVCTGSEANDLALRLARAHTGQRDVIVVEGAYHGNLTSLIDISPYKFDGPGGTGAPGHVHKVGLPDGYRGVFKYGDPEAGKKYAEQLGEAVERIRQKGRGPAAYFCEPLLGCAGQIVLPQGYLEEAYRYVRDAGGVCVADEVQVGFGRVGQYFWGFETQGVVPDIITLGKPIGNGFPLAAVVTTREIADSFDTGMEYFNTYGGNPVSCAAGLAVLDVIEEEELQKNALSAGAALKTGLTRLMEKYPLIGDVRGMGLFVGIELVLDRDTLAPAPDEASYIAERMKDHGVLISVDGCLHNVLKIKPPMVFSERNADFFVSTLEGVVAEDFLKTP